MRQLKIFSILLMLATLSSCGKDDYMEPGDPSVIVLNESISGTAMLDTDGDGLGDTPLVGSTIYYADSIYKATDPVWDLDPNILHVQVDATGNYLFDGLVPAQGKALFFAMDSMQWNPTSFIIVGIDTETDGDFRETDPVAKIYIDVDPDENDAGNDFVVERQATDISGSVFQDTDLDGVGDLPVASYNVDLYTRLANGQPDIFISAVWTGAGGFFSFAGIDPGEYVLFVENSSVYDVFSGEDATPDPDGVGDPSFPNLIPVDLIQNEVDADNNFVLRSQVTGTVEGFVGIDVSGDGNIDDGFELIRVGLIESATGLMIKDTYTDQNGAYKFDGLLPGVYSVELLDADDYNFLSVGDSSDDGDATDGTFITSNFISVFLLQGESDLDNNFIILIERGRVSGRVLQDLNSDGVGDVPIEGDVMQFYYRAAGGEPTSPTSGWNHETTTTDANGYYSFESGLPDTGEFVIYYIGSPGLQCVSSEDLSPEAGEPQNQHPQCIFIQVDLPLLTSEDHDNIYIVE